MAEPDATAAGIAALSLGGAPAAEPPLPPPPPLSSAAASAADLEAGGDGDPPAGIHDLPDELLARIFSWLPWHQ